ncbi:MAG: hypothetical protein MK085_11200, partial [Phycisphaerales bacterium]|nr:hypothetical protein [Phycisphaerales bacterium]
NARYSPQFFATATGATTARSVLAMAIDANDTALVRDAVAALGQTTGRGSMFRGGNREPLLECLRYPDRRVQYDAALVLGSALPRAGFPGDTQVVPLLASAVRSGGNTYAAVISSSEENRNQLGSMLRDDGFTLLNGGSTFYEFQPEVERASGVDLIVVDASPANARETVSQIRNFARTSATPVIVVSNGLDKIALQREFASDRATKIWLSKAGADGLKAATENLMQRASGGRLSQADALGYTRDALGTLHAIAIDQGSVYKIVDAEPALLEALGTISGAMRIMVADVLSLVPTQKTQRALIDAALSAQGKDQVALLDKAAQSARRFGNYAEDRQVQALGSLISDSSGAGNSQVADAAGRLYGSLNLPADDAVKLIID